MFIHVVDGSLCFIHVVDGSVYFIHVVVHYVLFIRRSFTVLYYAMFYHDFHNVFNYSSDKLMFVILYQSKIMSIPPILISALTSDQKVWKIVIRVINLWILKEHNGLQHVKAIIHDAEVLFILFPNIYLLNPSLTY